jgi:translation initiation factor 2 subunit 1
LKSLVFQRKEFWQSKKPLKKGESFGTEDIVLKIQLVSPPLYVIGTLTTEEEKGIKIISEAIEAIKEIILEKKGTITVKAHPRVVSSKEDQNLFVLFEKLKKQNEEVPADSDSDIEDDDDDDKVDE